MTASEQRFTARTHVLSDGTLVAIELREGKVYGSDVHEWQAWSVVARPGTAVGKETLIRGGSRDTLQEWASSLTAAELSALAHTP